MDPRLRELERAWQASGAFADGHAYAQALSRSRAAPLDLVAELATCLPERATKLALGDAELELAPAQLPGGPELWTLRQQLWQYTTIALLFARLDGVHYLLRPRRGLGAFGSLLGTAWPGPGQTLARWHTRVGAAYFDRQRLDTAGFTAVDLGPALQAGLEALPPPAQFAAWAPYFATFDVLYHHQGHGSGDMLPGSVYAPADLPPALAERVPRTGRRTEPETVSAYVHKTSRIDGWSGVRERLSYCTLQVDSEGWRFAEAEVFNEEDIGLALS